MGLRHSELQMIFEAPIILAQLLDVPEHEAIYDRPNLGDTDLVVQMAGYTFALTIIPRVSTGKLKEYAEHLKDMTWGRARTVTPLVVTPFMTDPARGFCNEVGISWFDLSGNAHIIEPGLRVIVKGQSNRFRGPGRPETVFAPKSSRMVRWLLIHHDQTITQRELASETGLSEGYVSRIANRLVHDHFITRDKDGALRVKHPPLLLDAWRDEYRFDKHTIVAGHVASRSGDGLTRFVSDVLNETGVEYAATGMSAAWQYQRFASFRIATLFLGAPPSVDLLRRLGFRDEERGANLWLVIPNDNGVYQGAEVREQVRCVHPVQAYLDLKAHPERAETAAEQLRSELESRWRTDD